MIIVSKPTSPISDVGILLGRQGENKARQIEFDLSWLIEEYGNGTAVLVHQRSKDGAPYICTTSQEEKVLTWTLNNLDTAYDGWGQAELRWTVNDVLAKTLVYKTMVVRSITSDAEIPDPYESWYDQMIDYIDENAVTYQELGQAIEDYIAEHPISAPVQSVNNKTGAVVLTASDVGAGTYSKPSGGIPSSDMTSAVQTSLGKADSAYQKPSGGIPATDLSSAVQTSLGKADTALQSAPVSSVNSKTGTVTLASGDIGYDSSATYNSGTVGKAVSDLMGDITNIQTATSGDIGKALSPKTVSSGTVTEWQYVATGGGGSSPSPYTSNPSALGTASPGSSDNYARGDHVHPKPTAADLGITVPSASSATPQALGSASAGSSSDYSRADHVHAMPTAANVGAIAEPSTAGTLGQVLTSDGQGGQSWQTPSGGSAGNFDLIGSQEITQSGITEVEFTQNLSEYTEFVLTVNYKMLTYGDYSIAPIVTVSNTKLGVYVNNNQILQKEGIGTSSSSVVFSFSKHGGNALGKSGNGYRVGWLAGTSDVTLSPPISGTITSIKLSILTSGSEFKVNEGNTSVVRLYGR